MRDDGSDELSGDTLGLGDPSLRPHRRRPPSEPPPDPAADYRDLTIVDPGHYTIVRELARGGMGRILEARDRRLGRSVAIKEVTYDDDASLARFEREARITARLQHPSIVHVHEAGRWPSGQPFYAMKLIRGQPLDVRIAAAETLAERLALLPAVIAVADALAFAHSESVIHRDLKPANVLVGDFGETVVIDWGIAKDLTASETDDLSIGPFRDAAQARRNETLEGAVMGTPAYMPPEQAAGDRVDARADVYALGALLYQLLAGAAPYTGRTTADVLAAVLETPPTPLAEREPEAPIELVAIVEKAMSRDAADRFPSAQEMVVELKRFQQGQLVASHRYTAWELVVRWLRKHRAAVVVAGVAVVALLVLALIGVKRIVAERDRADAEAAIARARADEGIIDQARAALPLDPTQSIAFLKELSGEAHWREARMIAADALSRGIADVLRGKSAYAIRFSFDGTELAVYEYETGDVRIWDLATKTSRTVAVGATIVDIAIDKDGKLVATDDDAAVWRWDTRSGAIELLVPASSSNVPSRLSPDGTHAIVFDRKASFLIDIAGHRREYPPYRFVTWTSDGRTLFATTMRQLDRIDAETGALTVVRDDLSNPHDLASDGTRIWAKSFDLEVAQKNEFPWRLIVDVGSGRKRRLPTPIGRMAAVSPGVLATTGMQMMSQEATLLGRRQRDGRTNRIEGIVAADTAITISDDHDLMVRLVGNDQVPQIAVSRDGTLASVDQSGRIRLWRLPVVARSHGDGKSTTSAARLTADRRELVMTRLGPKLDIRDVATGVTRTITVTQFPPGVVPEAVERAVRTTSVGDHHFGETTYGPDDEILELAASANGRRLVSLDDQKNIVVWDLDTNTGRRIADAGIHVAISPDGTTIATAREGDILERWDVATAAPTLLAREMATTTLAISPDNRVLAASLQGSVYLFAAVGKAARTLAPSGNGGYRAAAFTPDGSKAVLAGDDAALHVYDLATNTSKKLAGHAAVVTTLVMAADNRHFAASGADPAIRVWDLADDSSVTLRGHTDLVTSMVFEPDDHLVTASDDHTARVWDLRTATGRTLTGHADVVLYAAYVPGGSRIVVVDRYRQVAEYPDDVPVDGVLLRAWLANATNLTK
ncbi:MAG: WD40 repeat domain-containing serine/threonine-protein kinase [Kofleriaceae bacterium]